MSSISHRIIRINLFVAVVFLHHSFIRFHGCLRRTMQSNKYKENKRFNSILPNETDSRTPQEKERNRWKKKKLESDRQTFKLDIEKKGCVCGEREASNRRLDETCDGCICESQLCISANSNTWILFLFFFFSSRNNFSFENVKLMVWRCVSAPDGGEFSPEFSIENESVSQRQCRRAVVVVICYLHLFKENYSFRFTSQFRLPLFCECDDFIAS